MRRRIILPVAALTFTSVACRRQSSQTTNVNLVVGHPTTLEVRPDPFREVQHGKTRPIREIATQYLPTRSAQLRVKDERTLLPERKYSIQPDGALQTHVSATVSATIGESFDGLSNNQNVAPPDPNGAVGTSQYVEVVNDEYGVYDKTGKLLMGPVLTNALWSNPSFNGTPCQNENNGDATVAFDKLAKQWVIQQFVDTPPFGICAAVSTSDDATGEWNGYAFVFNFGSTYFADYPKLGIWPAASDQFPHGVYLLSVNIYVGDPGPWNGPDVCFMDRGAMLAGLPATRSQCWGLQPAFNKLIPADVDGGTAPPNGESGIFMTWDPNWRQVDLIMLAPCYPNCSHVTARPIDVAPFTPYFAAAGHGSNCTYLGKTRNGPGQCDIPEASGDGTYLDSMSDRPMYRLAYRTGSQQPGHVESLTFTHTVLGIVNRNNLVAAVRWYEIRDPGSSPFVAQAGTFAPNYHWRWMGSTAMDGFGDQAIGYSLSETQLSGNPGPMIAIAGRTQSDPANTMENEVVVLSNYFYQNGGLTRWGDYSSMQIDPVDDCTFWYTGEYLKQTGAGYWGTHVVTFKFPSCQ